MKETGITATAGIGTNLYLCKIAMDIGAKTCNTRRKWCAYRRTDGAVLPGTFMGSQAADRFLAGRHRNQEEAGRSRTLHDGRHCQMLFWAVCVITIMKIFFIKYSASTRNF